MMIWNFIKEQDFFSSIRIVCEKKGKLSDPIHQEVKSFFLDCLLEAAENETKAEMV